MHFKKLVQRETMTTKIWHFLLFQLGPPGIQYRNYTLEVNQKHPAPPNSQGRPPNAKGDKVKKRPTASVAQWEACRNRWNTREWSSSVSNFRQILGVEPWELDGDSKLGLGKKWKLGKFQQTNKNIGGMRMAFFFQLGPNGILVMILPQS